MHSSDLSAEARPGGGGGLSSGVSGEVTLRARLIQYSGVCVGGSGAVLLVLVLVLVLVDVEISDRAAAMLFMRVAEWQTRVWSSVQSKSVWMASKSKG